MLFAPQKLHFFMYYYALYEFLYIMFLYIHHSLGTAIRFKSVFTALSIQGIFTLVSRQKSTHANSFAICTVCRCEGDIFNVSISRINDIGVKHGITSRTTQISQQLFFRLTAISRSSGRIVAFTKKRVTNINRGLCSVETHLCVVRFRFA